MKKNKIYILMERTGIEHINKIRSVGFVKTKKEAKASLKKLREEYKHICEISIKNVYAPYDEGSSDYADLCYDFEDYLQREYFPQYPNFEFLDILYPLTDEEFYKLRELYEGENSLYATNIFRNWCKNEKGLSDEVIEATIKYNTINNFNTISYYIEETKAFNIL